MHLLFFLIGLLLLIIGNWTLIYGLITFQNIGSIWGGNISLGLVLTAIGAILLLISWVLFYTALFINGPEEVNLNNRLLYLEQQIQIQNGSIRRF